jgi:polysaccharide pyruvyl transferase WcaK-like protein
MKPKIGIFALPFSNNYGGILLAYALQKALSDIGNNAIILRYQSKCSVTHLIKCRIAHPRYGIVYIVKKSCITIKEIFLNALFAFANQTWQTYKCEKFRNNYLFMSKKLPSIKDLENELRTYNVAIIGGDQIWNPYDDESANAYYLNFKISQGLRKVSYAPCFGRPDVPATYKKIIGASLCDFDFIGVRNKMSQEIVKRLSGRDATLVVDPTLLVSFDEVTAKTNLGKEMIAFYCIKTSQLRMYAIKRALKKKLRYKVLSISLDRQFLLADKWAWGVGPSEWLAIFKNAEYIITDSFHGTIFALKNRKQFITIVQHPTDVRMVDLLQHYGLEERIVYSPEQVSGELMLRPINYDRVHAEIARDVQASYEYLKTSLA